MAAWAYYAAEQKRHAAAVNSTLKCTDLQPIAEKVIAHFGLPGTLMVTVKNDRKNCNVWSWFKPATNQLNIRGYVFSERYPASPHFRGYDRIEISKSAMNVKTLAHELAHCLHYREYRKTNAGRATLPSETPHSTQHKIWMDKIVAYLKTEGYVNGVVPTPTAYVLPKRTVTLTFPTGEKLEVPRIIETSTHQTAEQWWAALPENQLCTKCNHEQHKDEFGMRTVSEGKYARQGYCRTCRKNYYKTKKLANG